jgi:hypothetical protein
MEGMMASTANEKLAECERELKQRHWVYPKLIRAGKLRPETASRQIQIMNEIAEDYRRKVNAGPLFENQD